MSKLNALILIGLISFGAAVSGTDPAAQTNQWPDFKEVFEAVQANLAGADAAELNRAAVAGFCRELEPMVKLLSGASSQEPAEKGSPISMRKVFDEGYGYIRIGHIAAGVADEFKSVYDEFQETKRLKGIVLDLRYADGRDYAAAAAVSDMFIEKEQVLLSWGEDSARSTAKTNAIKMPVAVLVNRHTVGAAEALAAVLRQVKVALLLGSGTAGQAAVFKEIELSSGQVIQIASAMVSLADGKKLSRTGIEPDIKVEVSETDERAYYADAYKDLPNKELAALFGASSALTNPAARARINEAELVRLQRESQSPGNPAIPTPEPKLEHAKPTVKDPVLGRALDLLKGLAIVQK